MFPDSKPRLDKQSAQSLWRISQNALIMYSIHYYSSYCSLDPRCRIKCFVFMYMYMKWIYISLDILCTYLIKQLNVGCRREYD